MTALPDTLPAQPRFLGRRITPLTQRRLYLFRANKRGFWALWIFLALFIISLFAEFIANDRPILVSFDGHFYVPVLQDYTETTFGGDFETFADYKDPYVAGLINAKGWMLWPLIPYSYDTAALDLPGPAPTAPDRNHWLGTDDQARDVLARVIYGFRISTLFGLTLSILCTPIGIFAGALQGYFGGAVDLFFQRFLEIFGSMPTLFLLMILASAVTPNFWWLLGIMVFTTWTWPVGLVRAEFLRARNFEYVRAARALGRAQCDHHAPPPAAQCHGLHPHLPALPGGGIHHLADLAGFPRLRPAARLGLLGRSAASGPRRISRRPGSGSRASSCSPCC